MAHTDIAMTVPHWWRECVFDASAWALDCMPIFR